MISILMAVSLVASAAEANTFVYGIGSETCADAHDPERTLERQIWTMGYWSGLNAANKTKVGKDDPVFLIFELVERHCLRDPDKSLMQAVLDVWNVMHAGTEVT